MKGYTFNEQNRTNERKMGEIFARTIECELHTIRSSTIRERKIN